MHRPWTKLLWLCALIRVFHVRPHHLALVLRALLLLLLVISIGTVLLHKQLKAVILSLSLILLPLHDVLSTILVRRRRWLLLPNSRGEDVSIAQCHILEIHCRLNRVIVQLRAGACD